MKKNSIFAELQICHRQHHDFGKGLWVLILSFSCSKLPDRGQDDAAQQSQVHGEWGYRLCPQASAHV